MSVLTPPSFHNINLDLVKMQAWAPQQIYATAGDTGYAQVFSLYMSGDPYTDASPEVLNFRAIKPDGNVVDIKHEGFQTVSGSSNKFVFTIPEQVFAATGRVECFFYITTTDGKMVASTTHFFYEVQRAMPSETGSISMIATLDDVVNQAHDLYAQAMSTMSEITATKTDTDKQATNFAVDLKQKQADAEKQADQMLANVKTAMDKTAGDATDYQTKLDDLNKQYITKYNELLAKLPDADTAVQKKIGDALAQLKIDEQQKFQEIEMDWVKQKETLSTAITDYENSVTKQLDDLKQQIVGISSEKVTKLSSDIDALQQKLASLNLSDYYTKKEIDDKLDSFQPKIDLSGYETTAHAEDTYAKKTDIVAPNLSAYETTAHASETYETKEDAASHLTKTQADATYASKSDIPDVSGFETKTDADATYAKKSDIPASPDLSTYETVAHADETFAKKSDIVSPDLTDYAKSADVAKTYETKEDASSHLTKTQADADYATKADLANVKPDMSGYVKDSELADYAKKSDVSPIKTIRVLPNGWPSDAPGNKLEPDKNGNVKIDLSQYVYESEFRSALPDLSYYLSKSDAEATYAKKSDIPDVSKYVTKTDADADYVAKTDAANFATKTDLEGYAKKGESTGSGSVDLTGYLKKDDADKTYTTMDAVQSFLKNNIVFNVKSGESNWYGTTPGQSIHLKKDWSTGGLLLDLTDASCSAVINADNAQKINSDDEMKKATAKDFNSRNLYKYKNSFFASGMKILTDANTDLSNFATKDDLKNIGSGSSSSAVKTINIGSPDVSDPSATDVWGTIAINPDASGTVNVDRDTLYNAIFNHHSPVTSISVKASNGNTNTVNPDSVTGELQLDLSSYLTSSDANKEYALKQTELVATRGNVENGVMYDGTVDLTSTYVRMTDLVMKSVINVTNSQGGSVDDDAKTLSSKHTQYIFNANGNYYLGGHKLAFAD